MKHLASYLQNTSNFYLQLILFVYRHLKALKTGKLNLGYLKLKKKTL